MAAVRRGPARRAAMLIARGLAGAGLILVVAGCTGAGGPSFRSSDERRLDPVAQPGTVAASDIAFARALREEGATDALRRFAADNAIVHLPAGPVSAAQWLAQGGASGLAADWRPREIWSSCDGSLSVSLGRTRNAVGLVGSFVTVWRLRRDGGHEWSYLTQVVDDPQPPPRRRPEVAPGDDTIVVEEISAVTGRTADCQGGAAPLLPVGSIEADDGTLAWRYEHQETGGGRILVDYSREGSWQRALDFAIRAPAGSPAR